MNLANINTIKNIMNTQGFAFKKALGQNFLINPGVCPKMAAAAADSETGVLEIGPGIGVLTAELSSVAKRVVSIELDNSLKPVLEQTLAGKDNIEIIFGDAMKLDLLQIINTHFCDCKKVAVCANLPYYITSPVITMLLESRLPIDNITVMVQKEAAERICAKVGSRESGAVTVAVNYYAQSEILFGVSKNSFMPPPKVSSSVVKLQVRKTPAVDVDEKNFFNLVKAAFAQRRKTLLNAISNSGITKKSKEEILNALTLSGIDEKARGETLSIEMFATLSENLF